MIRAEVTQGDFVVATYNGSIEGFFFWWEIMLPPANEHPDTVLSIKSWPPRCWPNQRSRSQ